MSEPLWIVFTRNVTGPKLEWLMAELSRKGIPNKLNGVGPHGPLLWIDARDLSVAQSFYRNDLEMAEVAQGSVMTIAFEDLPEHHSYFTVALEGFKDIESILSGIAVEDSELEETLRGLPISFVKRAMLPYIYRVKHIEGDGQQASVLAYDVKSSHISSIGLMYLSNTTPVSPWAFVVQFKDKQGLPGEIYAYSRMDYMRAVWVLEEAERVANNEPNASVGHVFDMHIKKPADSGQIVCQRYIRNDGDRPPYWGIILPKFRKTEGK